MLKDDDEDEDENLLELKEGVGAMGIAAGAGAAGNECGGESGGGGGAPSSSVELAITAGGGMGLRAVTDGMEEEAGRYENGLFGLFDDDNDAAASFAAITDAVD